MNRRPIVALIIAALVAGACVCANAKEKKAQEQKPSEAKAPEEFAPVPADHPLAGIWNDPDFARRLIGSYGFLSDVEPKLSTEEREVYVEKIVPLLRDDQTKAMSELKALIKPNASALFEFTLGNLYFQSEDFTNAVNYFEQAVAKFPDFRRAWQNLGFALARDGKYEAAIEPLAKAIELGANNSKSFGLLGFCYMNKSQWVSAEAAYRQAMLQEPENADFKLAIVKCEVAQANYTAALAMLNELLQKFPDREQIWSLQANVFLQTDQSAKAAVNFEVLRRMGKATAANLALLGDIYMTQDAKDLALSAYQEAIEMDGGRNLQLALRAADILVSRGAWDQARALFAKIRSVAGDTLAGAHEMKLLKLESKVAMSTGRGEQAIKVLEKIIEKDPLDGEALLLAGDYFSRNGDKAKAEFRYDMASKIDGFEADAFVKLAQLKVQSGKYADAMELLAKAQKIEPRDNVQRYLEAIQRVARSTSS